MSEESNALDEAFGSAGRSARMAVMMGGQAAEVVARRVADQQRRAAEESRDRTAAASESFRQTRDAARKAYEPVADPSQFESVDQETAVAAWATAKAWSETDPRAAQAEAALAEHIKDRWGVDADDLFPTEDRVPEDDRDPADPDLSPEATDETQGERFAQAMDPKWREEASDAELERLWHEANSSADRPGAGEARTALDAALAERHGVDLEKFHQALEEDLGQELWHAEADRATAEADQAAEAHAERQAAGWENEATGQHSREATADDAGEEIEESVDASQAEGLATAWTNEAEAARGEAQAESRADAEAMTEHGVPPRSQEVRTTTARGFGTTTEQGAQSKNHRRAKKNTRRHNKNHQKDMGR